MFLNHVVCFFRKRTNKASDGEWAGINVWEINNSRRTHTASFIYMQLGLEEIPFWRRAHEMNNVIYLALGEGLQIWQTHLFIPTEKRQSRFLQSDLTVWSSCDVKTFVALKSMKTNVTSWICTKLLFALGHTITDFTFISVLFNFRICLIAKKQNKNKTKKNKNISSI